MARTVAAFATIGGGSLVQIILWKEAEMTYFDALTKYSMMWVLYLLVGLLIGEHTLRWLKKSE